VETLQEILHNQSERQMHNKYMLELAIKHLHNSIQMLEANARTEDSAPFEDYSLFVYRQTAPSFQDLCRDFELKLFYPLGEFEL
jgi:hypothetical protein